MREQESGHCDPPKPHAGQPCQPRERTPPRGAPPCSRSSACAHAPGVVDRPAGRMMRRA
jgi:hypothetical protein